MVYAYIIGRHFLAKEFDSKEQAFDSLKKLSLVPHEEKLFFLISERKLTDKEATLINVIQQES